MAINICSGVLPMNDFVIIATIMNTRIPNRLFPFAAALIFTVAFSGSAFAQDYPTVGDPQTREPLRFEVSFSGSTAIGPNETWLWEGGFGFNYLLREHIRVGFEQLGYASTSLLSGSRSALSIAPMVEYSAELASPLEVALAAGVPLQVRFGADPDTKLGVAPFVRVGIDIRTSEIFSFGVIERFSYVMSDAYIMSEHGLPSGAMIFATGLGIKFHF